MASVDEAIQVLQSAQEKLDEVRSAKGTAKDEIDDVTNQVAAIGLESTAEALSHVGDVIDAIDPAIQALADAIDEAITAAKAAIDGT